MRWSLLLLSRSFVPGSTGTMRGKRAKITCVGLCFFFFGLACLPPPFQAVPVRRGESALKVHASISVTSVCIACLAPPFQAVPVQRGESALKVHVSVSVTSVCLACLAAPFQAVPVRRGESALKVQASVFVTYLSVSLSSLLRFRQYRYEEETCVCLACSGLGPNCWSHITR